MLSTILLPSLFVIGYLLIVCERELHLNKSAIALVMACCCWMSVYLFGPSDAFISSQQLYDVAQIIFFLLAVMIIVELIDSHHGFKLISDLIYAASLHHIFWFLLLLSFFLSAVLDNLTTMVIMASLLRKLVPTPKERWLIGSVLVISVNAGGAWTPIGDVSTTLLWIRERISTWETLSSLFLPSLLNTLVCGWIAVRYLPAGKSVATEAFVIQPMAPGARWVFCLGVLSLIMIPIWHSWLNLPPFMGALLGLGTLWLITDIMHVRFKQDRWHLRVLHVITKIDISGLFFFLGALLAIDALETGGTLRLAADWLSHTVTHTTYLVTLIGLLSSVIDNIPLVAAMISMYPIETFGRDAPLWQLTAYAAGTGGSLFIIGSAAGIVWMGIEKINFLWYAKHISWIACIGYFVGIGTYLAQQSIKFFIAH